MRFYIVFLSLLFASCIMYSIHDELWSDKLNSTSSKILRSKTNGYYKLSKTSQKDISMLSDFILYQNGYFAGHGYYWVKLRISLDRFLGKDCAAWGKYNITEGDSIFIQYYTVVDALGSLIGAKFDLAVEIASGTVKNDSTILIHSLTYHDIHEKNELKMIKVESYDPPLQFSFAPLDSVPSSDGNWLEKQLRKRKK